MKILVFSDSHGDVESMYTAVDSESPDMIIHLGDTVSDAELLHSLCPGPELLVVAGNCDLANTADTIMELEVQERRIFMTHGHTFGVKNPDGIMKLLGYAKSGGANVVLFGHTHKSHHRYEDGILLANPGHIGVNSGGGTQTYGILSLYKDGGMDWTIVDV